MGEKDADGFIMRLNMKSQEPPSRSIPLSKKERKEEKEKKEHRI